MSTWLLSFLSRRSYIVWRFRSGMWNDHPSHQSQKLFPGTEYVKKTGKYKERTILNGEHLSKQFCLKRKVTDDISYSMKPHISIFRFHVWLRSVLQYGCSVSNHIEDVIFPPGGLIAISPSHHHSHHHTIIKISPCIATDPGLCPIFPPLRSTFPSLRSIFPPLRSE